MKRFYVFIIALSVMVLAACGGCNRNVTPDPDFPPVDTPEVVVEPDLSLIEQTILVTDDWIFSGKPSITFRVKNPNEASVRVEAKMRISTDQKQEVEIVTDSVDIAGNSTKEFVMTTTSDLAPGFYRAVCWVNNKTARSFFFGIDPFDIVSAPDKQADYDAFWTTTKNQLAATPMDAVLTEITDHSSATRKVYLVEMKSIADGLTGDPVTIRGYYCEPQDGQQHPVIMHFYGYDTQGSKSKCECPQGGTSQYAEFYLSHRGQYLNNRPASTKNPGITEDCVNIYGDWFAYNFGDKDGYYYRGAFMDCVRAVDFMASRPTSDMTRLFAEGSSQGGGRFQSRRCALLRSSCAQQLSVHGYRTQCGFPGRFSRLLPDRGLAGRNGQAMSEETGHERRADVCFPLLLRHQEYGYAHLLRCVGYQRTSGRYLPPAYQPRSV